MTAIVLRLLAGRYHATPWGHHVNEGALEWPPSPWRILRALLASWFHTAPDVPEKSVRQLLHALSAPPHFQLPAARPAHTRHYMPWFKKGPEDKTLVFDTFLALEAPPEVTVAWPDVTLEESSQALLVRLLAGIPYLGRAESWCEAALGEAIADSFFVRPLGPHEEVLPGERTVRALCWDGTGNDRPIETVRPGTPKRGRGKSRAPLPHPLLADTGTLRKRKLDPHQPPAGIWVRYALPRSSGSSPSPGAGLKETPKPTLARFTLHGRVLPRITDTIALAELARGALQARYGRANGGGSSPVFSGKDAAGRPSAGHVHAHFLPADEDGDGRIEMLTVYAPQGFGPEECRALASLRELRRSGDAHPLRLVLVGLAAHPESGRLFGPAKTWVSTTPFVLPRHPKANGRDSPLEQLQLEIGRRGHPSPRTVDFLPACETSRHRYRWLEFRRWRRRGRGPALARGFGFRIHFARPVRGPLCLGYGSHFGLGLFFAEDA